MVFEPKKIGIRKNPPVIVVRISEEENEMMIKEYTELGLNRSDFIRLCISEHFNKAEEDA